MELPYCNGQNFQIFLNELSNKNPDEFKVVVLDNGAFHKWKGLEIPKNISLVFLPPYSPELNPAELLFFEVFTTSGKAVKTLSVNNRIQKLRSCPKTFNIFL